MSKVAIIIAGVAGLVVVAGGIIMFTNKDVSKDNQPLNAANSGQKSKIKLVDPHGDFKVFSDPSVTKYPKSGMQFGKGQTLSFEYDGSKTGNDPDAVLSYYLYYIQADGNVQPMGGSSLEGSGSGTFTTSNKVFNSLAKDADGFVELVGTHNASFKTGQATATDVKLGMYPIKFTISD